MRLVQRSLGLAAFLPDNPVERLLRDLAVYLRQPAPDAALADGAAAFMADGMPPHGVAGAEALLHATVAAGGDAAVSDGPGGVIGACAA
jgi:hypothetical protein